MKFTTELRKFTSDDSRVYGLHFLIPYDVAAPFLSPTKKRVKYVINESVSGRTGLMSAGDYWYILCNESIQKKLSLKIGDNITMILEEDNSTYGVEMPEELQVVLDQDEQGNKHFHNLTPGKQRNLIYIVSKVKNIDSRISKSLAIIYHLNEVNGVLNFKLLAQTLKDFSQKDR